MNQFRRFTLVPLLLAFCLFQSSCASFEPSDAGTAVGLATTGFLIQAKDDAERIQRATYVYAIAHNVSTLAEGHVPTAKEFSDAVTLIAPGNQKWSSFGVTLAQLWAGVYPRLQGNKLKAAQYLHEMASAAAMSASPYLPTGSRTQL